MMTSTPCTIEAEPGHRRMPVRRLPLGVGLVLTGPAPAALPAESRKGTTGSRRRLLVRDAGEYLFVGLRGTTGDPAATTGQPAETALAPGDVCFYDARRPPLTDFPAGARAKVFLVPCALLGLADADVPRLTAAPVSRTSRLGALLSPLLSDLAHAVAVARSPVDEMLARNAVNVLATLAAERLEEGARPDRPRSPLVAKILEYVELHLGEPELTPEVIARAHHISVRYLHKLFQEQGTSVGRWVQRRRLEECRRELVLRGHGNRTIAAVAGRWGFLSATHFSRVFRTAYGMSPREWRDTAAGPQGV
ncbi:helix-turn-helix domain-containing protein [Streptomyces sp. NPDC053367]|uniref:helix-turn-helix domain-containing protein n=1 Tax=Streptomyces sp. NPDC053367 TaxID=3365700 RepID=UPI0037D44B5C